MSASGQKQTRHGQMVMSALRPKSDSQPEATECLLRATSGHGGSRKRTFPDAPMM
jgi:hypothetical protein